MSPLSLMSLPVALQQDASTHAQHPSGGGAPAERRAATAIALIVMALSIVAAFFAG